MPLRIRSHITYPQKPKPVEIVQEKPKAKVVFGEPWTERQDAVLLDLYKTVGPKKLGERFGRTPGSVTQRYLRISGRVNDNKPTTKKIYGEWTPYKDTTLRTLWGRCTIEKLIAALEMSQGAIYNRAHFLGLQIRLVRTKRRQPILARID